MRIKVAPLNELKEFSNYTFIKGNLADKELIDCKRQVICWIENHIKKIDNYIEN